MYEGLYNTRKGLAPNDLELVGGMTSRLMHQWGDWVHRRVDKVTFSDEDALSRAVSIDFTLPHWFHQIRDTSATNPKRQLVPLGFFRKEALFNFSLNDESYSSLPLLTAPQTAQVAEAVLVKMGEICLGTKVPPAIRHDIHGLIYEGPAAAAKIYGRLFEPQDSVWKMREQLGRNAAFANTAGQFRDSFLALAMIKIACHERRVIHFSFEEQREPGGGFLRGVRQALGKPRRILVSIQAPAAATSYHLEVEAPDGLMITGALGYHYVSSTIANPVPATATLRRAHFHLNNAPPHSLAVADISFQARRSSVVRAATLTATLTLIAMAVVAARFSHIENSGDKNAAAAALLLAVTGIIGLIVARSGEGEMATNLLFPLRVLGITPAVLGVLAAVVVVADPTSWVGYSLLGVIWLLTFICTGLLIWNWRKPRVSS